MIFCKISQILHANQLLHILRLKIFGWSFLKFYLFFFTNPFFRHKMVEFFKTVFWQIQYIQYTSKPILLEKKKHNFFNMIFCKIPAILHPNKLPHILRPKILGWHFLQKPQIFGREKYGFFTKKNFWKYV